MKKTHIFLALIALLLAVNLMFSFSTAWADCGGASTVLVECGENENGIGHILTSVINIFSVIVGSIATVGIGIVGVQYLTAGGNEEQTRKAKRRMLEIVLGLIAFVLLYFFTRWLLPSHSGVSAEVQNGAFIVKNASGEELARNNSMNVSAIISCEDNIDASWKTLLKCYAKTTNGRKVWFLYDPETKELTSGYSDT